KINGVETTMSSYGICIALDNEGYDRKFVVEEGTGTWCGYCPRGIVGMQKMTEKYPDSFIGIAIHDGNDPFVVSDYQPVVNEFFYAGLPHCVANRDPMYVFDPNIDYLNLCKDYWAEQRAPAKVDLKVEKASDGLKVAANTTFAYSEDNGSYKLAFVILEDGLQSQQRNYYSGYPTELEWWGDQPEYVDWTYEHTARDIVDCAGIVGSIPTKIVAKTPMTYERLLPLDSEIVVDNTSIVALILESRTGVILNATKVMAKDYIDPNAISAPSTDNAQPADYFNLQGMRVGKDTKGSIIVRRQGGKISKFVAR
ncbi:MAG: Omp28-related outer membrane protein, partial [Prevotella sp.]|nr:Omp28-related outer membrane protein [Prevotella sp.]